MFETVKVDEDFLFDGAEDFVMDHSSIVEMLDKHQEYFEAIGDGHRSEEILRFMMWLENEATEMEQYEHYMREEDIINEFEEHIKPGVIAYYSADDEVAIRTAFNDYTDALRKDDKISEWQYMNGENPY